jgi:hypothetical protein
MPYTKIIISGDNVEKYEYEKEPRPVVRGHRKRKINNDKEDLGADGGHTLSEEQLGKRQDNARRTGMVFRRIVASNLSGVKPPLLLTLTYKKNIKDIEVGYKDYRSFVQALRNKFGKAFSYIAVCEFQKRGAIHFHALFWGLPSEIFLQERQTRTIALIWKHGYVYMKETDGNDKLSSYLAKYMVKTFTDPRLKNKKSYLASRNIKRPKIIAGEDFSFWSVDDEYIGDRKPIVDTQYDTLRMGRCRYRYWNTFN